LIEWKIQRVDQFSVIIYIFCITDKITEDQTASTNITINNLLKHWILTWDWSNQQLLRSLTLETRE
jgi:hypothetical protein